MEKLSQYQVDYYNNGLYSGGSKAYSLRKIDLVIQACGRIRNRSILDLGCYNGTTASEFKDGGARVVGSDIAHVALKKALSKIDSVVQANVAEGLPFKAGAFDIVYCSELIEHVLDTDSLLREMSRVVTSRGFVCLTTPNICAAKNRFRVVFGKYPYNLEYRLGGAGHIHLYNLETLQKQISEHGLRVCLIAGVNLLPWKLCIASVVAMRANRFLSAVFPSLCLNIFVAARKLTSGDNDH